MEFGRQLTQLAGRQLLAEWHAVESHATPARNGEGGA